MPVALGEGVVGVPRPGAPMADAAPYLVVWVLWLALVRWALRGDRMSPPVEYSECRVGGWTVCIVYWTPGTPRIDQWRTDHLTPAQREECGHWLWVQLRARGRDETPEAAYRLLFVPPDPDPDDEV